MRAVDSFEFECYSLFHIEAPCRCVARSVFFQIIASKDEVVFTPATGGDHEYVYCWCGTERVF
jgi:hypothetical protein